MMTKYLILAATLITGGLTQSASAQRHYDHRGAETTVFISGYLPCGTPIYSKRVRHGHRYYSERLNRYELQRYLERQSRIAAQRELQRRLARERYRRSPLPYYHRPVRGRCR